VNEDPSALHGIVCGRVLEPPAIVAVPELPVADNPERRSQAQPSVGELKREINAAQLATLDVLERFGWHLKFIRRGIGVEPFAVLHDPDARKYAVLDAGGELDENPVWHRFRA
jgi:hypothetical protein